LGVNNSTNKYQVIGASGNISQGDGVMRMSNAFNTVETTGVKSNIPLTTRNNARNAQLRNNFISGSGTLDNIRTPRTRGSI